MIVGGLHVVTNARVAQNVDDFADSAGIAAAPDQLDALFALALVERSSTEFFRDQLDTADGTICVSVGIFRVAERTVPHGLATLHSEGYGVAAAEAQGGDSALEVAPLQFVEQRDQDARAARADGMAEADGPPFHIDLFGI